MEERLDKILEGKYLQLLYLEDGYKNYKDKVFLWCETHGKTFSRVARDVLRIPSRCTCEKIDYSTILPEIKYKCESKSLKFIRFIGEEIKHNTRCELYCETHNEYTRPDINHIRANRFNCKTCKHEKIGRSGEQTKTELECAINNYKLPDIEIVDRVKVKKKNQRIFYKCTKCSYDNYVRDNVCEGVFESTAFSLKDGKRSCRCSKNFRHNKKQNEYRLKNKIDELGGSWVGWVDEAKYTSKDKLVCMCKEGHCYEVTVDNMLRHGLRCNTCVKYGFDFNLPSELYITYWYGFGLGFLKTGVTNGKTSYRVHKQGLINYKMDYEVLYNFKYYKGLDAFNVEQKVKECVGKRAASSLIMPSGWTETVVYTDENLNEILNIVSESFEGVI
ncbi:conserved hypothetical protein [Vibrio phage 495E54-1]|nr:conserved hypothetical protein [Vibrio phage 495E54-1]